MRRVRPARRTLAALLWLAALAGCQPRTMPALDPRTGGDPAEGARLLHRLGCGACHEIPGVVRANGLVGPSLARLRERVYIGGVLPNTPAHLVDWIVDPRRHSPRTAMPSVGATEEQARHMAAYLYSL